MFHSIEEAVVDLKDGKAIIVVDVEKGEGSLAVLAEKMTPEMIALFATKGRGQLQAAITQENAKKIGLYSGALQQSVALDLQAAESQLPTGKAATILQLINPAATSTNFQQPGHVLPVVTAEKGVLKVPGFAEAGVDLAILAGAVPAAALCAILQPDGSKETIDGIIQLAADHALKVITIDDLADYRKGHEVHIVREVETVLPSDFGDFRIVGYSNDLDDKEHIAIVKGDVSTAEPVMARIHSECFTGDIFGSHRCDCGPQLHAALAKIEKAGRGVIVYMRQEGRGIGLLNKLRAYKLQDAGFDTHEANVKLGFKPDAREYHLAAQILQDLGVQQIELLTNNPDKIASLKSHGIPIAKRIPLQTGINEDNTRYMETKLEKFGHMLDLHS